MTSWHLTFASDGRNPLFPEESARRAAVRRLARAAGKEIVLFSIVDDHLHVVLFANRRRAGRLAQAIVLSLRPIAATPVEPARLRAVETRSHLEWLVPYLLRQVVRHAVDAHPALWSGSCFQELVGARAVEGLVLRIQDALPRFRLRTAYQAVGLAEGRLQPASDEVVRAAGAARLVTAAAAALAAPPALAGRRAPVVDARRAAVQLARRVGLSGEEVAWALRVSRRSIQRHVKPPVRAALLDAVRLRLALEDAVSGTP